jgi:hypothetical protein
MLGRRIRMAIGVATLAGLVPATVAIATQPSTRSSGRAAGVPAVGLGGSSASWDPAGLLRGAPIRGMILSDFNKSAAPAAMDLPRIRALGVNTVVINIYVHQSTATSSNVHIAPDTISDASIADLASRAHKLHMDVELAPIIVIDNEVGGHLWRGHIAPTNVATWFNYYIAMVRHYELVAIRVHAEIFSIGSELCSMEKYTTYWQHLGWEVNKHYSGLTTYMSAGTFVFQIPWWNWVDVMSTSAYYSLSNQMIPPVDQMVYVWNTAYLPRLQALSSKFRRRVYFDEVGYGSQLQAAFHPSTAYESKQPVSQQAQANAYTALIRALVGKPWLQGVAWWHWDMVRNSATNRSYSMRDKMAECVIAKYWAPQNPDAPAPANSLPDVCLATHAAQIAQGAPAAL